MNMRRLCAITIVIVLASTGWAEPFFPTSGTVTLEGKISCPYMPADGGTAYLQLSVFTPEMGTPDHRPMNLAIVLDRSGSMGSEKKIENARAAVRSLVDQLRSDDILSIVIYDDIVEVLRSSSRVGNKEQVKRLIDEVYPRGWTNLGGGLWEGYRQVKQHLSQGYANRVILLSDGLANRGITNSEELAAAARRHRNSSISLTTIGVGLEYNENLMISLAEGGGGNYYFVEHARNLASQFGQEFRSLARLVGQNATIDVSVTRGIRILDIIGSESCVDGMKHSISLGDLYANDRRDITVVLQIPEGEGYRPIATATLRYTTDDCSMLASNTVSVGIHYTRDRAVVEKHRDSDVEARAQVAASTRQVEDALRALDRGDREEAVNRIRQVQHDLAASPAALAGGAGATAILEQQERLKAYADTISQGETQIGRAKKSIQYDNYRTQKTR